MSVDLRPVGALSELPVVERERCEAALKSVEKFYGDQNDLSDANRALLIAEAKAVVQCVAKNRVFASKEAAAQPIDAPPLPPEHQKNKIWTQLLTTAITSAIEAILNVSGVRFAFILAPLVGAGIAPQVEECAKDTGRKLRYSWDC